MYVIIVRLQALLLARIEASMAGDRQVANNLVLPKKLQEEAVRYALSARHPCTLDSHVVYVCHTHVQLPPIEPVARLHAGPCQVSTLAPKRSSTLLCYRVYRRIECSILSRVDVHMRHTSAHV